MKNGLWERFETEISPMHRSTYTSTSASSEDGLACIIIHMCRGCMHDDCVHAKRNGRAVPLNSRRPKDGEASHIVDSQK